MKRFEDILVECIEDIKAGRSSIEDCLERYPSIREQLEPLLRIALAIQKPPHVKPSADFKLKARVRLIKQIHEKQAVTKWPWARYESRVKRVPYRKRFSFSMASVILAILLTLSLVGGGTAYASQASLPGDALYSVKLATEQVIVVLLLSSDDAVKLERALGFADKRVMEMEALAEKGRAQDLDLAVEKYDYALNTTLAMVEEAFNKGLAGAPLAVTVAQATAKHLPVLDRVYDMVPDEAKAAIAHARNVSETRYFHALEALAKNSLRALQAVQVNLATIEGRLTRVGDTVRNTQALQIALQQFEAMAEFNEEICQIARERGLNTIAIEAEELIAEATSRHLEVLAEVWDNVPEQAKPAIERAMANLQIRHQRLQERIQERIREREQQGAPYGTTPPGQGVPGAVGQRDSQGRT